MTKRGGVFVGVDHTGGGLPTLQDAAKSAVAMREWAVKHGGIDSKLAIAITDRGLRNEKPRAVTRTEIFHAVDELIAENVSVIILYFSGHAVTAGFQNDDQWLLSGAPHDPNEAVSVTATVACARYGAVSYVCIISDACRTPAAGALQVEGGTVFPNNPQEGQPARSVDIFYSCRWGQTSKEVGRTPDSPRLRSWYTSELLRVLGGTPPDLYQHADKQYGYLWPRDLRAYFESKDFRDRKQTFVRKAKIGAYLNQNPDAILVEDETIDRWLARRLKPPPADSSKQHRRRGPSARTPGTWTRITRDQFGVSRRRLWGRGRLPAFRPGPFRDTGALPESGTHPRRQTTVSSIPDLVNRFGALVPSGAVHSLWDLSRVAQRVMEQAAHDPAALPSTLDKALRAPADGTTQFVNTVRLLSNPPEPPDYDTGCGVCVRGAAVTAVRAFKSTDPVVRLTSGDFECPAREEPYDVVIALDDGTVAVVPVIPNYIAALTFSSQVLIEVAYEPGTGSPMRNSFVANKSRLRAIRAVVSAAILHARYRLDGLDVDSLLTAMQYGGGIDPTLALYTSYALYEVQKLDLLAKVTARLGKTTGCSFYDIELTSRNLDPRLARRPPVSLAGRWPMLSSGWPLLSASQVAGLDSLLRLRNQTIAASPWTLLKDNALGQLQMQHHKGGKL